MRFRLVLIGFSLVLSLFWVTCSIAQPSYPKEYPDAFPQHKSCQMVQVMNFPDNISAMLNCGKTPSQEVYDFYLNRAKKADWEILLDNRMADFMMFMAEKDNSAIQVQVVVDNGATQLALSLVKGE